MLNNVLENDVLNLLIKLDNIELIVHMSLNYQLLNVTKHDNFDVYQVMEYLIDEENVSMH